MHQPFRQEVTMWKTRKTLSVSAGAACAMSLLACASSPPKELTDARQAYQQAQSGPAAQWNPAQLHEAETTLQLAEQTFEEEGDSARARDRAYVAQRKAQLADVQARITHNETRLEALKKDTRLEQTQSLGELRDDYAAQQARLQETERARTEAEQRAKQASEELARIAQVKEEPRGTVITISGSVLFASGEAELLPPAQARLGKVAKALLEKSPGSMIVVEGHTDTQGSAEFNLDLSERRAKSVRQFLISQGVPDDRIQAKGVGFAQPVAPNKTAEGRANNRRVEIILQPRSSS
jgi:outer membrane protein OmpA-like peptidoglycan-associated protein